MMRARSRMFCWSEFVRLRSAACSCEQLLGTGADGGCADTSPSIRQPSKLIALRKRRDNAFENVNEKSSFKKMLFALLCAAVLAVLSATLLRRRRRTALNAHSVRSQSKAVFDYRKAVQLSSSASGISSNGAGSGSPSTRGTYSGSSRHGPAASSCANASANSWRPMFSCALNGIT